MFDAYAKPKPVSFVAGGQVEHRPDEAFPWLWKPYLAFGMLSVLDGDPGVGKSLITCDLAARLATGRPMPDGSPKASYPRPGQKHACTIFVNVDDSVQHVIVPRLFAAGCPPRVALFISGVGEGAGESRAIRFPHDMAYLTSVLSQQDGLRGAFVVLDPVMAMMSGAAASSDQAIRATLNPLVRLAAESQSCILLVRHLNKTGAKGGLYRGGGSIGLIGACRTGLLVGVHPDDPARRVLSMTKSNIGPRAPSLAYRIETVPERTVMMPLFPGEIDPRTGKKVKTQSEYETRLPEAPAIAWEGPTPITADDLCTAKPDLGADPLAPPSGSRNSSPMGRSRRRSWRRRPARRGLSYATVRLVKAKLNIESQRVMVDGVARWEWALPKSKEGSGECLDERSGLDRANLPSYLALEPLPPLEPDSELSARPYPPPAVGVLRLDHTSIRTPLRPVAISDILTGPSPFRTRRCNTMRITILGLACLLAVAAGLAEGQGPQPKRGEVVVSDEALAIHRDALLIDGHNDLPWELRAKDGVVVPQHRPHQAPEVVAHRHRAPEEGQRRRAVLERLRLRVDRPAREPRSR